MERLGRATWPEKPRGSGEGDGESTEYNRDSEIAPYLRIVFGSGQDFLKSRIVFERVPFPQTTDYLGERRSPLARKFPPTGLWSAGRFALRTTLSSANRDREWPQCRYRSVTRILCARW